MARDIDALTSSTLKHLRGPWWDDAFTSFLREPLHPRSGNRILDVGCGVGTADVSLGLLQLSQVKLYGVDRIADRVCQAVAATRAHNIKARFRARSRTRCSLRRSRSGRNKCVNASGDLVI